ncbi:MAG: DMT family transporter [Bacteroidales bacterium]|nr:DMT family transporter [Bacteroidales bacterium]
MSVLSACLLGFHEVAKKQSLKKNGVLEVIAVYSAITAVFLLPFISLGTFPDHLRLIVKASIVSTSWISGLAAMKRIPLTTVSTMKATRPVFVVVFSIILFGERLNLGQWAGVIVVIGSLFLLARVGRSEGVVFTKDKGILYMVISILTGAGSALWDKHIMQTMEPLFVQSWTNIYITVILSVIILIRRLVGQAERKPFQWDWNILLIAVFITAADALYFFALHEEGSMISVVSLLRRASVIVSFIAGAVLYKENKVKSKAAILLSMMVGICLLALSS